MAAPFPVAPDNQTKTLGVAIGFNFDGGIFEVEDPTLNLYISGGVNTQANRTVSSALPEPPIPITPRADAPGGAFADLFGHVAQPVQLANDFFTRVVFTTREIMDLDWVYPDVDSFFWHDPLTPGEDGGQVEPNESIDFLSEALTPETNDFFKPVRVDITITWCYWGESEFNFDQIETLGPIEGIICITPQSPAPFLKWGDTHRTFVSLTAPYSELT